MVALLQFHHVAGHQGLGGYHLHHPLAPDPHLAGQHLDQGRQGALRLELLPEAEHGIDQDHAPDRPAQLRGAGDKSHGAGGPEHQGHEMA